MNVSPDVVILSRADLKAKEDAAFKRGVELGKFEAGLANLNPPKPLKS